MTFVSFITTIFSFFHQVLVYITATMGSLFYNNIIILSLCVALLFFIIDYMFDIVGLLPRILGMSGEQEKEYRTKTVSVSTSEVVAGSRITRSDTITKRKKVK